MPNNATTAQYRPHETIHPVQAALLFSGFCIIFLFSLRGQDTLLGAAVRMITYVLPWLVMFAMQPGQTLLNRDHRPEIMVVWVMMGLSLVNIITSDVPRKSLLHLTLFFTTGIIPAWTAMLLFRQPALIRQFDRFCAVMLALVIPIEIIAYVISGFEVPTKIGVLLGNPIPTSTLVLLLACGPISLLASGVGRLWTVGIILLAGGTYLLILTQRRGAFLAGALMVLAWLVWRRPRWGFVPVCLIVALAVLAPLRQIPLKDPLNPNIIAHFTILVRMELYPFAAHVFMQHPLFGMGVRNDTLDNYLQGYQQYNKDLEGFPKELKRVKTFDNMIVTFLVELGSLFKLAYFTFVGLILYRFTRFRGQDPELDRAKSYRLLPLLGLAIHSLFYDSLMFPAVNWLFHVNLGILGAMSLGEGQKRPEASALPAEPSS